MLSNFLLILTILLAPLYVVRFKLGPLPTTLLELLIILTTLSYITERTLTHDSLHQWKRRLFSPFTYPAFALMFIGLISVAVSPNHYQALGIWRAFILEPIVIFFILLAKLRETNFAKQFLLAWFGSAIWISLLSGWQKIDAILHPSPYNNPRLGRPEAVFNSANDIALFIGPLAALSILLVRLHKALIVVTLILFTAVWISGSRGGAIGLGAVETLLLLAYIWRKLSPHWRKLTLRATLALTVTFTAVLAYLFFNLGTYRAPPKNVSQHPFIDTEVVRACLWQGTRNLLLDHPIFGVGLDGFSLTYSQYHTCDTESFQYPHDIVLNIWSELGLAGLAVFAWIYFVAFRLIRKSHAHWIVKTAFVGALAYSIIHGLVDVPYFKNDLSLEFWILLAAITALKEDKLTFGKRN